LFEAQPFARELNAWFLKFQRDLPWRVTENIADPYRILISEIMLQQTTVGAVKPFFERFITRFPTVKDLAEAPESDVLTHWAGLGYYARARNLQKAAQSVQSLHNGVFPRDFEAILALSGVGRYTAGAIASIAFEQRKPIVDANVARVLSRVLPVEGDLKRASAQGQLWRAATQIVEVEEVSPRSINPALMELGALVCTPKNPKCDICPVAQFCEAKKQSRQNELPQPTPKKVLTPLFDVCIWAKNSGNQILMRQRSDAKGTWWPLMWELPRITRRENESSADALQRLSEEIKVDFEPIEVGATIKHGVTRYSIELECFRVEGVQTNEESRAQWFSSEEIETLPKPSSMQALLKKMEFAESAQLSLFNES
jgi:A/G-specific adenine glycosylase